MVDSEFVAVGAENTGQVDRSRRYAEAQRRGRAGEARLSASRAPCAMIVTMAYDEDLANRIRELIAAEDGYTEQKMFGGIDRKSTRLNSSHRTSSYAVFCLKKKK